MAEPNIEPLPPGFQLAEYRIDRKIAGGGFGIVYLAHDAEGGEVAIKEYSPSGVVCRLESGEVQTLDSEMPGVFLHGLKCFFEEGRLLAQIQHPNVVRVLNFFRANETVYMVMRYEQGKTLQRYIREYAKKPIRESFLRRIFVQLLNGLREVHANKLLHLDIKPANILIRNDFSPVLLDFGAARQISLHDDRPNSKIHTPGYAAPEQYDRGAHLGPWTDLYGVGACLYACMDKAAPIPADTRLKEDRLEPAATRFAGQYSDSLLKLADSLLKLDPAARPQSVFEVQHHLIHQAPPRASADGALPLQNLSTPDGNAEKTSLLGRLYDRLNRPL